MAHSIRQTYCTGLMVLRWAGPTWLADTYQPVCVRACVCALQPSHTTSSPVPVWTHHPFTGNRCPANSRDGFLRMLQKAICRPGLSDLCAPLWTMNAQQGGEFQKSEKSVLV